MLLLVLAMGGGCETVRHTAWSAATANSHAKWEAAQGGRLCDAATCARAARALDRMSTGLARGTTGSFCCITVLNNGNPAAYSFSDGSIYVARGLVDRLTDDELAAAVAHELGHLVRDGVIASPAALRGAVDTGKGGDVERTADLIGRELLAAQGISVEALPSALEKVAAESRGTSYVEPLGERIRFLRSLR